MATHTASWAQPGFPVGNAGFDRSKDASLASATTRVLDTQRISASQLTRLMMVILRVLVLPLVIAAVLLMALAPASTAIDSATRVETYVVVSGDTLWDIAAGVTVPSGDIRATIDEIEDLNGLTSGTIRPGQSLFVPRPF